MYHLCGSLEGAAGQVLMDLPTDAKTTDVINQIRYEIASGMVQGRTARVMTSTGQNTPASL